MVSFRNARPPNLPPDMAILAQQMQLGFPVRLSKLIADLSAPTGVQFNTAGLPEVSGIAASATLTLSAQGFWIFAGGVNNSNAITQQFAIGMVVPFQGQTFWVNHSGQVGPNLPGFSNTAHWNVTGFDQRIVDYWPQIFGVRSDAATASLHTSINVGDALEAVGIDLAVAGALVLAAFEAGKNYCCDSPVVQSDGFGGIDVVVKCYPC